jgi:hypothetical protein
LPITVVALLTVWWICSEISGSLSNNSLSISDKIVAYPKLAATQVSSVKLTRIAGTVDRVMESLNHLHS